MYEIKIYYFMGRALVRDFHTRCLYQKSHPLAALSFSISDTSPTRAKIPNTRSAHEVISIFHLSCKKKVSSENLASRNVHIDYSLQKTNGLSFDYYFFFSIIQPLNTA